MSTDMEYIILKGPSPKRYKESDLITKYFSSDTSKLDQYVSIIESPVYLYWNKAMHKPKPDNYSLQEAWMTARVLRKFKSIPSPVTDVSGKTYSWVRLQHFDKYLHDIDFQIGGKFLVSQGAGDEKQKFLTRGIIEEAIASSQLEGASTTRKYAKKMIVEKKKPRTVSEKMIYNNYVTMVAIEEEYKNQSLSIELIKEMHVMLTQDTLDDPNDVGRIRAKGDDINVIYGDKIAHKGPGREFIDEELPKLVKYANDNSEFIHPIIKASILHFWVGYLHPFADGNGRLARSIFYWYLFKNDYWGITFVPISMVLKRAKKQYTYAYIHTEQDNYDLTYFIDFSIQKIMLALKEFNSYVENLANENKSIDSKLGRKLNLNDRQKQIIYFVSKDVSNFVSELSHRTMNGIARNTARSDIKKLVDEGLLVPEKEGKVVKYYASDKLRAKINETTPTLKETVQISENEQPMLFEGV